MTPLVRRRRRQRRRGGHHLPARRVVVEVHCTGRPRPGESQRGADCLLGAGCRGQAATPLGHCAEHLLLVDALVGVPIAVCAGDAIGDDEQREAVERRLCRAVDRARRARTTCGDRQRRASGEQPIRAGHHARSRLAVGEHEAQPGIADCADDFEVRSATREPEHDIGTMITHAFGQHIRQPEVHRRRTLFHKGSARRPSAGRASYAAEAVDDRAAAGTAGGANQSG